MVCLNSSDSGLSRPMDESVGLERQQPNNGSPCYGLNEFPENKSNKQLDELNRLCEGNKREDKLGNRHGEQSELENKVMFNIREHRTNSQLQNDEEFRKNGEKVNFTEVNISKNNRAKDVIITDTKNQSNNLRESEHFGNGKQKLCFTNSDPIKSGSLRNGHHDSTKKLSSSAESRGTLDTGPDPSKMRTSSAIIFGSSKRRRDSFVSQIKPEKNAEPQKVRRSSIVANVKPRKRSVRRRQNLAESKERETVQNKARLEQSPSKCKLRLCIEIPIYVVEEGGNKQYVTDLKSLEEALQQNHSEIPNIKVMYDDMQIKHKGPTSGKVMYDDMQMKHKGSTSGPDVQGTG